MEEIKQETLTPQVIENKPQTNDTESKKNYYLKNKDKILAKSKEYREKNKENLKKKQKEYYEKNRDTLKEKHKQYYEKNKDKANKNNLIKIACSCGIEITKAAHPRHLKRKIHIINLEKLAAAQVAAK